MKYNHWNIERSWTKLLKNKKKLEILAKTLVEKESLGQEEFEEVMK